MKITYLFLFFITLDVYSDTQTDVNILFDWAESEYPDLFYPQGSQTIQNSEWYYRYYKNKNNYLGVNSDGEVHVMGDSWNKMQHIDSLQSLLADVTTDPEVCVDHKGLMWEVKTTDGGLRDVNNKYNWYDPNLYGSSTMTGEENCSIYCAKCTGGINCTTHHYVQEVNRRGLCGYHDWRMPTISELKGLVDTSYFPTINTNLFPNTPPSRYWSTTTSSFIKDARGVFFDKGTTYSDVKWGNDRVRLVREHY